MSIFLQGMRVLLKLVTFVPCEEYSWVVDASNDSGSSFEEASFSTVCPCPPGQHRDASGNCVPDTPPPEIAAIQVIGPRPDQSYTVTGTHFPKNITVTVTISGIVRSDWPDPDDAGKARSDSSGDGNNPPVSSDGSGSFTYTWANPCGKYGGESGGNLTFSASFSNHQVFAPVKTCPPQHPIG